MVEKQTTCRWKSEKIRIKQYEELLKVEHNGNLWNEDMDIKQPCKYLNRKDKKTCDIGLEEYRFLVE